MLRRNLREPPNGQPNGRQRNSKLTQQFGYVSTNFMSNTTNIPTPKLLDEEKRIATERAAKISRVTLEVEAILLREDMTVGDLLEVFGLFTGRANSVFEKITIKKIKEMYEQI